MPSARGGRGRGRGRGRERGHMYDRAQSLQALDRLEPPEGFRELSVFPTEAELHATLPPFLRRNITKGCYINTSHYLDVQYRLMREDFIRPLRKALAEYRTNQGVTNDTNNKKVVKVYTDVNLCQVKLLKGDLTVLVEFDGRQVLNPDNAFKTGSLLCLSMDNFENIIIGTVGESYSRGIAEGHILIKLHNQDDLLETVYDSKFSMLEPDAFFDPYHHVMNALQSMALHEYPMCNYVTGNKRMTQAPAYLSAHPSSAVYHINDKQVSLFDGNSWPPANELGLNPMQYKAYKMALCSDMALIQGPPGTGKTFLGLKVAQTLIENLEENAPPILVVCATNHALDQFLEHLTTVTNELVRCGSQSQSTLLQNFTLSKWRNDYRASNRELHAMAVKSEKKMCGITRDVKRYLESIRKIVNHRGVVSLESLTELTKSSTLAHFGSGPLENHKFLEWLEDRDFHEASNECLDSDADSTAVSFLVDFKTVDNTINTNTRQIEVLETNFVKKKHGGNAAAVAANLIKSLKKTNEELISRRDKLKEYLIMDTAEISHETAAVYKYGDAWKLPTAKRWQLYHHWTAAARLQLKRNISEKIKKLNEESCKFKACKMEQDLMVLKDAKIVGMTTSCSARLRPLLDNLMPRIMIVEEAAEVLEGHIVASLTRHCQHVILIGDHKQLRPMTSSHEMTHHYNLDVSLFERLLNNKLPCVTLQVQHRMRPEIAKLITPAIYPQLTNHHTVMDREDVLGVDRNVFFVTHKEPDELAAGMSRQNEHEAEFLLALCRYLLQDYTHDKITIIATYAAQVSLIQSKQQMSDDKRLKRVHVSSVDGYQGEENDIILLSLVRSNQAGHIGFLRTPNRVCVALSRAKIGLYVVGDMECLTKDPRSTWCAINDALKKQQAVSAYLTLRCKTHRRHVRVTCAADFHFDQVERTGCSLGCDYDSTVTKQMQDIKVITREFFNSRLTTDNGTSSVQSRVETSKPTMPVLPFFTPKTANVPPALKPDPAKKAPTPVKPAQANRVANRTAYQHIFSADYGMAPQSCAQASRANQVGYWSPQPKPLDVIVPNTVTIKKNSQVVSSLPEPEENWDSSSGKYMGFDESQDCDAVFPSNARVAAHNDTVHPTPIPAHHNQGAIPKSRSTPYSFSFVRDEGAIRTNQQHEHGVSAETSKVQVPQEVPRVNPRVQVSQEHPRMYQDVPRVTSRVQIPQEVPRVNPRVQVPQEVPLMYPRQVPRIPPRVVLPEVPHVTARVLLQENHYGPEMSSPGTSVEYASDAVLGIHSRQASPKTPGGEKKKRKCVIQ